MVTPEEVYNVVKTRGPIIPNSIKKALNASDSTLINVFLSELKKEGLIRLTNMHIGSSRFAYIPSQKEKLQELIIHLNQKDRRVAEKLREEGVIRAKEADPLTRVSLSNIKDFAKPITVRIKNEEEVFYKWYLLSSEEAEERIKKSLNTIKKEKPEEEYKEEPLKTPDNRQYKTANKTLSVAAISGESSFSKAVKEYFKEKNIILKSMREIRNNKELEGEIDIPTPVGMISYFYRAKNKNKSNEGDIAGTLISARARMLNALYLTTGTVIKKAKKNKELKEVLVVEIGNSN